MATEYHVERKAITIQTAQLLIVPLLSRMIIFAALESRMRRALS